MSLGVNHHKGKNPGVPHSGGRGQNREGLAPQSGQTPINWGSVLTLLIISPMEIIKVFYPQWYIIIIEVLEN